LWLSMSRQMTSATPANDIRNMGMAKYHVLVRNVKNAVMRAISKKGRPARGEEHVSFVPRPERLRQSERADAAGGLDAGGRRRHNSSVTRPPTWRNATMSSTTALQDGRATDWRVRLDVITSTMREMSRQTDPMEMRKAYGRRMQELRPTDRNVSLSRRGLQSPEFRVTRSTTWDGEINPWTEKDRLPLLSGGVLAELIYADEPRLFDDLEVADDDPAFEYLQGMRSLAAIPMYDGGAALYWVLLMRREPGAFALEEFPDMVWVGNLFGRATHNLVLSGQLKAAFDAVDHELRVVAEIQRSLLPVKPPTIPTLSIAAFYQTSHRAGGDYYDFFPLVDGKWGILIADVSGHGTPAAVLMAVTHSLAHTYPGPASPPGDMLTYVNRHLTRLYTASSDAFVTAFYGVYDPAERSLRYSSAGHNPPRLKRCQDGTLALLDAGRGLPLGLFPDERYGESIQRLVPGDQLVLYTDGVTEAENAAGEQFGLGRLDKVLANCAVGAPHLLNDVLADLEAFTVGRPPADDRTLLVIKVS
jgi:sigma-B regulation protein RsbU (phosphoserine phosphatase)